MNATAIYSKSGKGVQEASGKTSLLSRPDRAVLSAIDGRATLADVAQKVGKTYDPTFQRLIESLDKGGFIREVSPGAAAPASKGAAPGKPAGGAPADAGEDLDFTAAMSAPSKKPVPPPQAGPRPAPPPPKINVPPPPPPPSAAEKRKAEDVAKQQQDAFAKAREEAERKAQADRDRLKAESEAKIRAETETKLRAEAEAKAKAEAAAKLAAEADAKIKAAQEAAARVAAEAKAKAEAEARKAREEAERARREADEARRKAEEQAERVRKEAEEKIRREQEEMKRKLEAERKAREEAERKAKEEARRLEEERRKLEEERKRREEERRKEEEERAARRKREEEEEAARRAERKKREEDEEARAEAERVARRKAEEEEEARERAERKKRQEEEEARQSAEKAMRDARLRAQEREEEKDAEEEEEEKPKAKKKKEKPKEKEPEPEVAKPAGGGGFSDTLLADLDSFNTREEAEQKEREEAERKRKEAEVRRRLEEEERKAKEEAARKEREEKERIKREAQEAKRREEEELKERQRAEEERLKEEEEKRKKEAEERERKAKQDEQLEAKSIGRSTDAFAAEAELKRRRERQLGKVHRDPKLEQEKKGWGKPIAVTLFLLLLIGVGVAHVMPIAVEDYERGATEALGQPVRIASANLSLYSGLQLKFSGVSVGDTKIATVRAFPEIGALTGPNKAFNRIEIEGLKLPQSEVGGGMFAKLKADGFKVERLVFTKLDLTGPLALPKGLEVELQYDGEGVVRQATVRGPEALLVRATPKGGNAAEFEMSASSFTLPFASEISFSKFGAKGTLTPQGLNVTEWDGSILNGTVSGTASMRWTDGWAVNGVVTARGINAAVFAPALLSDGRAEGSGKFAMRGNEAGKLASEGRLDGSFTVSRGVLGSIDLSRAIQTGGKQATGRTQFNEMNGQATYDRGQIQLRNIQLSAGQLNAGASVDISQGGALSGRIVADVKVASQTLKANLNLGGTLKEPQVRN